LYTNSDATPEKIAMPAEIRSALGPAKRRTST
jgi:hypothetical protein